MKIDFTQFDSPIDGLTLSDWEPNASIDVSPEDAVSAGINKEGGASEFLFEADNVDIRFTPSHEIQFGNCSVAAGIRPDNTLQSFRVRSLPLSADEIFQHAKPIVSAWGLHSFEDMESVEGNDDKPLKKADALIELGNWRDAPAASIPSFLAQTDPNPHPGVWFLRLVINHDVKDDSLFVLSAQAFWRDREFDEEQSDETFWERADALITLANDQASKDSVPRVAVSLMFAAARYNAFDYWTQFDDRESFKSSREDAIEQLVGRFREMLEDNFDDHLEQFNES